MVEVFKTSVTQHEHAVKLISALSDLYPHYKINFDLHDCDNILRVEGDDICNHSIINVLACKGYECCVLE